MKRLLLALLMLLTITTTVHAAIGDYLILQDIGLFKLSKPEKVFAGEPPIGGPRTIVGAVVVDGADHFDKDHTDTTYEVDYFDFTEAYHSPNVQVSQHTGGDSDKWLLHEIEDPFRDGEQATLGQLTDGTRLRTINNNKILYYWVGTVVYCWISGNVTVKIEYSNLMSSKPAPMEIINAYLQKYPSTLPASMTLDSAHDVQWIKDEMERRLWLSDKWFAQITEADQNLSEKLREIAKNMGVFLDYRERYYSGSAEKEKFQLDSYAAKLDKSSLLKKQAEYKQWNDHKGPSITLATMRVTNPIKFFWRKLVSVVSRMFSFVNGLVHS